MDKAECALVRACLCGSVGACVLLLLNDSWGSEREAVGCVLGQTTEN